MDLSEKNKLLFEFNNSSHEYDKSILVHQQFKNQAINHPERIALVEGTHTVTYEELDRRSDILAAKIMDIGINPDQAVGVNLDRGIEFTIAILASIKSGGCYVPLDPHYPAARLKFIIEAVSCPVLITLFGAEIAEHDTPAILVDRIKWDTEKIPDNYEMSPGNLNDLAYMLFTSGSTGEPKGVEIEHHNLLNLCEWERHTFARPERYHVSQAASICFDASVREFWGCLACGGTLFFIPRQILLQPESLVQWLCDNQINDCYLPTPVMELVMDFDWPSNCVLNNLFVGGDRLTKYPPASFPCQLVNLYGPAECTVDSTYAVYQPGEQGEDFPYIGHPVGNAHIYLLDQERQLVPIGEEGELYIGGIVVGRGYAGRPDLTAEAFVNNPLPGEIPDDILYKTGDLARYRPDGKIEFIGRNDFQVKIRGFRIELSEIEMVLNRHEDIKRSAVTVFEDNGKKFLAAYVTLNKENPDISSELYSLVRDELPEYMTPTSMTVLEALPLTHNGKIDRKKLVKPELTGQGAQSDEILTEAQKIIIAVWEKLLGVTPGLNDNFFALGGHSLMAMQMCSRVEAKTGIPLPLKIVFERDTLQSLAEYLEGLFSASGQAIHFVRLPRDTDEYPASGFQEATWRQHQFDKTGIALNIPLEVFFKGKVDLELLSKAFTQLVKDHEMLRCSFRYADDHLRLVLREPFVPDIEFNDLSELNEEQQKVELDKYREQERCLKLDLSKAPLWHFRLLKLSEDNFRAFLVMHHVIHDGWSSGIMFHELARNYKAYAMGHKPPSGEEIDYIDYVRWHNEYLDSGFRDAQMDFWRKKLSKLPSPLRLYFQNRVDDPGGHGDRCQLVIPPELTAEMKFLAEKQEVTLFVLLQAIYQTLLFKYSGRDDILTGATSANRRHPLTESMMGEFINAITLRTIFSGNPAFSDLLAKVHVTAFEALDNQDLPFVEINRELTREYGIPNAAFQYSLMLQNFPEEDEDFNGIKMTNREIGNHTAKMNILATFMEVDQSLEAFFEFNTDLYNKEDIKIFVEEFTHLAETVCANPDLLVSEIKCRPLEIAGESCFVIGDTALASLCTEKLLQSGINVRGVLSSDPSVRAFAEERSVPAYDQDSIDLAAVLGEYEFDYLFSIINEKVIKQNVLDLPKKMAINYHDSPLPRYAGMYATSWALINHETSHAVSWHVMTAEVDAGDILIQKPVQIDVGDSVDILDGKCFQAALDGFDELLESLTNDKVELSPQDLGKRTLFGLYKRPEHALVINWQDKAEDIIAMIQACAFKHADNYFGSVKMILDDDNFLIVQNAELSDDGSFNPVGSIFSANEKGLVVATSNGGIRITEACRLDGSKIHFSDLKIESGKLLPVLDSAKIEALNKLHHEAVRNEYKISKLMHCISAPKMPIFTDGLNEKPEQRALTVFDQSKENNITAFAIYIAWLCQSGQTNFVIKPYMSEQYSTLISEKIPWLLKIDLSQPFDQCLKQAVESYNAALAHGRFLKDACLRHKSFEVLNGFDFCIKITETGAVMETAPGIDPDEIITGFKAFCENAAASPQTPVVELTNLTQAEFDRQIVEWNNTNAPFDLDVPYITQFQKTVAQFPDKAAVRYLDRTLTYRVLDEDSSKLANYLIKQGLAPGETVAVRTDRSPETAIALLAVFKVGCAYLPLDSKYPRERIEYMLNDSGTKFLLWFGRGGTPCDLDLPHSITVTDLVVEHEDILETSSVLDKYAGGPNDTAYLMYTSGTTGNPKGVMIAQRNLVNHNRAVIQEFGLNDQTKTLQFASLNFDISVEEMFPTWLVGGELVFLPDGLMENPPELFHYISAQQITFLDFPTAYWHELVNLIDRIPVPDSVKTVVIGGEKASVEHFKRWKEKTKNIKLINSYGPTECTVIATTSEDLSCIGRPLPNCRIYIVDKLLRPVPIGCSGELMIGGKGVGQGYLNRPELTAEKFIENPYIPGELLYHSGDRVRYRPDGNIDFVGRVDTQIKLRGFRIEPGGIESAINRFKNVASSKVIVFKDNLAAYYTIEPGRTLNTDKLKKSLKKALPDYMVPAFYVQLDAMPLTPNGKVDVKALPAPNARADAPVYTIQAANPNTQKVVAVVADLLDMPDLTPDDHFFDMGGDSLKAIRLIVDLEKLSGFKLRMQDIYQSPTPRAMAALIFGGSSVDIPQNSDLSKTERFAIGDWSPVVSLKPSGSRLPLFLMHTTPGDIMGYGNLVAKIDPNQPVYGLQAIGLKDVTLAHKTVPDMAAFYIERIRELQPEGPYMLAGWCFGGFIAYEMAQQLLAQGQEVGFLGMLETWGQPPHDWKYKLHRLINLIQWGPKGWVKFVKRRFSKGEDKDDNLKRLDFISELAGDSSSADEIENMKKLYRINYSAGWNYFMKPYPGKIHLFMAEEIISGMVPDAHWTWDSLAEIVPHVFPGDHANILKPPNVENLAKIFCDEIKDAMEK